VTNTYPERRPPGVLHLGVPLLGDQLGDLLLEALSLLVGERHVVRVSADAQDAGLGDIGAQLRLGRPGNCGNAGYEDEGRGPQE
jgi:hypothetical protein